MNASTIRNEIKRHGLNAWISGKTENGFMVKQVVFGTLNRAPCIVVDEITSNERLLIWLGY